MKKIFFLILLVPGIITLSGCGEKEWWADCYKSEEEANIDELESEFADLGDKFKELESKVDDLESKVDDLELKSY